MPKELITKRDDSVLYVGWMPERHTVQIGVGRPSLQVEGNPVSDVWAPMDRHEVNKLIRSLRRARDSAFGADE